MGDEFKIFRRVSGCIGLHLYVKRNFDSRILLFHQAFNVFIGMFTFITTSGSIVKNIGDSVRLIEAITIWSTGLIELFALTICLINRNRIRECLQEMAFKDNIYEVPIIKYVMNRNLCSACPKLNELKSMVNQTQMKLMKFMVVFFKAYTFATVMTCCLYVFAGIYQFVKRTNDMDRPLGFEMWFPWSLDNKAVYIMTFVLNSYCGFVSAISYPAINCTFLLLGMQLIRHLKILTFILRNLDVLVVELTQARDERWQHCCTDILKQTAIHYIVLKRFSGQLNAMSHLYYLVLILNATLVGCVTSVMIAISDKLSLDTIKYYCHDIAYMCAIFINCMSGQQVENECERLDEAVLEKWYLYNQNHRKNVLIFKIALSQRMPIYIFGTVKLSLTTFTWYIKTGMSFFTLVLSVLNEN